MPDIEHPDITKMNQDGYLESHEEHEVSAYCTNCGMAFKRGRKVVEFDGEPYCNKDCVCEAFTDNPEKFGMQTITID